MQTLNDLINARSDDYSFLKNNIAEFSPKAANMLFKNTRCCYEDDFFDAYENLAAVVIFTARVSDDDDDSTFFILKYADHYEANVGAMMNEESGELIDLFDETCEIFDIRPQ